MAGHACPIIKCEARARSGEPMCERHWARVPTSLQIALADAEPRSPEYFQTWARAIELAEQGEETFDFECAWCGRPIFGPSRWCSDACYIRDECPDAGEEEE